MACDSRDIPAAQRSLAAEGSSRIGLARQAIIQADFTSVPKHTESWEGPTESESGERRLR